MGLSTWRDYTRLPGSVTLICRLHTGYGARGSESSFRIREEHQGRTEASHAKATADALKPLVAHGSAPSVTTVAKQKPSETPKRVLDCRQKGKLWACVGARSCQD